ncbi:FGGY-family carbohydrate kinase [Taklimakanibacter lacteus]|uniref:FGGY-family carbohydrate kinase n=1 Tax=Taklimakanibacter lacteus TaxID=2268456 RepID=UPI000E66617C
MALEPLLASLDLGTGRVRAVAIDLKGRIVAEAAEATPTHFPQAGWAEYHPQELWQMVCKVLRALARSAEAHGVIQGFATGSMGEAGVLIDAEGRELGPVIAWYCGRTVADGEAMCRELGDDYVFRTSGTTVDARFGLAKILWWRRTHPDVFAKARRWLNMADWVAFRLTGEARTDFTLASRTNALDLAGLRWADELIGRLGIEPSLFAPLIANGAAVGRVHRTGAAESGLPEGLVVSAGGHDHVISTVAADSEAPGILLDSMGTAEGLVLGNDKPIFDDRLRRGGNQQSVLTLDAPHYELMCGLTTSGGAIEWFRRLVGGASYDSLIEEARGVPPGSHGMCFLPQLRGGDQPYPNPNARGAFVGLAGDSTPGVLFRSVLEGLCFYARLGLDHLRRIDGVAPITRIRVIGGGTRNALMMKTKASIYGQPLEVTPLSEATCLSAAILGGLGAGLFRSVAEARLQMAEGLGQVKIVEPDPEWAKRYDELYHSAYAGLSPALASTHDALAHFRNRQ